MMQNLWINGRTPIPVFLLVLFFGLSSSAVQAGWIAKTDGPFTTHEATTMTLMYEGGKAGDSTSPGKLWLYTPEPDSVLLPETVDYRDNSAAIPLFIRRSNPVILVHDEVKDETSTVTITTNAPTGRKQWIPSLTIAPAGEAPVVYANQEVTPTLSISGGVGTVPPSAHLEATDHNGRLVLSRFFSSFELAGGLKSVRFPSIGQYTVSLRLLDDDLTSLPHATQREPVVIPFGEYVERPKPRESNSGDFITTDIVVGNIITFEHIPTTATVLSEDRIIVPVFGVHSQESRLNRWPYMLSDADIYSMPVRQQKTIGLALLKWQRAIGATFGQINVKWADIQTAPRSFRWTKLVDLLPLYRSNQVRPVLTLTGRSAWDESAPGETSETLNAWFGFNRQLSERFHKLIWGVRVSRTSGTDTSDGVTSYAAVLAATYTGFATRDGKPIQVAPILAQFNPEGGTEQLKQLLASEVANAIDGVAFDLYPRVKDAQSAINDMDAVIRNLKRVLEESGKPEMPVWLMNTGWSNGVGGMTQKLQANFLVRTHALALARGCEKVGWDGLVDKSDLPWGADPRSRMGLLSTQLRPKLAAVAYNNMSYLMSGITPRDETRQGHARIFSFNIGLQSNKWPGILYVAWTESPEKTQDVLLSMNQGGGVFALDYLGAEIPTEKVEQDADNPLAGTYRIPVGFEPVFIWDAGKPGNSITPPTEAEQE